MFNVIFSENEYVGVRFAVDDVRHIKKNEVASFLLHQMYNPLCHPAEISLFLSYLPFLHGVVICDYDNERKLEWNEIKLQFYRSTMITPSEVTIEVSGAIYDFFANA